MSDRLRDGIDRTKLTPMMQQYFGLKDRFNDHILLFRLGDFYEMFFDDALIASKDLEIALTKRDCGEHGKAPMCGIPHHVSEQYINKLVEKGHRVAICEQLEDPRDAKGIVERDVVRVVSPGVNIETDQRTGQNIFLMSVYLDNAGIGISYADITTGEIRTTESNKKNADRFEILENEILKINPAELIVFSHNDESFESILKMTELTSIMVSKTSIPYNSVRENSDNIDRFVKNKKYKVSLKTKGLSIISLSMLLEYIYRYQKTSLKHMNSIQYVDPGSYLSIDGSARFHLELMKNSVTGSAKNSLFGILNRTGTAMGERLLINWLEQPLLDLNDILNRQSLVTQLLEEDILQSKIIEIMNEIYDIERILGKMSYDRANARDLVALKQSIENIPLLKSVLISSNRESLVSVGSDIDDMRDVYELIDKSIEDEPPIGIREGGLIKQGYDLSLDELRNSSITGKQRLVDYEKSERDVTGIRNLKIVYNKKTGYFIDVTRSYFKMVPDRYERVQTLTNSERYVTAELKEIEHMILSSEEETVSLEESIFRSVKDTVLDSTLRIQALCKKISLLDVASSLASVAKEKNYVRPFFTEEGHMEISEGRHPIIEDVIGSMNFIPNDTSIGYDDNCLQLITGPNMSGKSTYLRQTAIICVMAQIGSYVPAKAAILPIIDHIFTRIGASDNLSMGDSTFMVEMKEMSYILKNATKRSLILLDEVGRGTSTYDGLAIAWAIVEHICKNMYAKTMFATHYHELTKLTAKIPNLKNLQVAVKEEPDRVVFLHKIVDGSADKSFGIEVAKLAGFPSSIVNRAMTILKSVEKTTAFEVKEKKPDKVQMDFSSYQKEAFLEKLKGIEVDTISPIDALNTLNNLVSEARMIGGDHD